MGSFTGIKGHREVTSAFERLVLPEGKSATLILNGNQISSFGHGEGGLVQKVLRVVRDRGVSYLFRKAMERFLQSGETIDGMAARINATGGAKRVVISDLVRPELVQAFRHADLFVFASNIEYSPLVLFESVAAGTPFLSVDVGNSPEIAEWTGAGVICPSWVDEGGYTQVDESVLAQKMRELMKRPQTLKELGKVGRETWRKKLTWNAIAKRYEQVFLELCSEDSEISRS